MNSLLSGKNILVTGGLGTIGSAIVEQLQTFDDIKQIRVVDNRETELGYKLYNNTDPRMRYILGDIRDKNRMRRAFKDIDIVYHAAALKHLPICEYNPFDAVRTNIIGTQNIIELALEFDIDSLTFVSTDKSVNPTNTLGATKLIGERLVHAMHWYKGKAQTRFSAVRFGNVLNSRGSVLDLWNRQVENGEDITVTDPNMTRFFMKIEEAAKLVIDASFHSKHGEIFILKMPAMKIGDVCEVFCKIKGIDNSRVKIVGIRTGEKSHEELILDGEEALLYENEKMFVKVVTDKLLLPGFTKSPSTIYDSRHDLLSHEEIETLLREVL